MKYLTKNICAAFRKAPLPVLPDLNSTMLLWAESIFHILHPMKLKDFKLLAQINVASILESRTQTWLFQFQCFLLI